MYSFPNDSLAVPNFGDACITPKNTSQGSGKSSKTRTRARRFIGERGEHTITDRMTLQEEKGVLNWRIATVVLFIIFAEQLVCSMLYADSPFLIEEYFPGVVSSTISDRVDRFKADWPLCWLHRFYVQYRPDSGVFVLGMACGPLWEKAWLDPRHHLCFFRFPLTI